MTPQTTIQQLTAISTYYDLATGASGGSMYIGGSRFKATGNTVAGKIKIWLYDGSDRRLLTEIVVPDTGSSVTTTVPSWGAFFVDESVKLEDANWKIQAELTVANTIDVITSYQDI